MTDVGVLVHALTVLAKWKSRLHLDSWVLDLKIVDDLSTDDRETCGQFDGNWWHEVGTIRIASDAPKKYRESASAWPDESDEQIVERIVVHELLHVAERPMLDVADREFSCYFGKEGGALALEPARHARWAAREMLINRLARVLIEADRSGGWAECLAVATIK
jgi:hypothetical protein